jgi:hypothetical protein
LIFENKEKRWLTGIANRASSSKTNKHKRADELLIANKRAPFKWGKTKKS